MPPFIWEGEGCGAGGYSVVPSAWSSVVLCHCFIYPDAFSQGRDEAHAKRLDGGGGGKCKRTSCVITDRPQKENKW